MNSISRKTMTLISERGTPAESFSHKAIKQLILKYMAKNDSNIIKSSLEKYFQNRRADVYFKFRDGKEVVVEIQNSRISVKEIIDRTLDYNKKGMYVLWLLNGKGKIVNSPKMLCHMKDLKISPAEHFLHKIYGGRVYYVTLNKHNNKTTITPPFALHFSPSKKNSTQIFKSKFDYYYIRNVNFVKIPNWKLLCVDYTFKIARFYDKHALKILKFKILGFLQEILKRNCSNCQKRFKLLRRCTLSSHCDFQPYTGKKLIKIIIAYFGSKYGTPIILKALRQLSLVRKIDVKEKIIYKKFKKYF
jgi:hypothetical protein